ncbi:MAG: bifunctional phosphopantothenoylcysteine decarboxylase/phosphopantothenate--cysteine ligase CoaBC [Gammaproteobacteria bacterium]|nr:bifunctional phosphopantothenoylcysteine decarboxylase/phosphopantothenate--cysteine ligase CoaBC [Gammaproteobacteria bacterium]
MEQASLSGKRIVLGITGSIAAYKGAELIRRLRDAGAEVEVVLTAGGAEFITPLTLQALAGRPVHQRLLDADAEAGMGHITLARWADALLIAPASADFIARLAQGRADDLLTAVCLAAAVPIAVAPAMNRQMWANGATRANIELLQSRGIHGFGPDSGDQACGEVGEGRMREPGALVADLAGLFECGLLAGLRVMVTAGPTREPLDPVRYLSNRSSGKMGFALASAAVEAGAIVTLISGPVSLTTPPRVTRLDVITAEQMRQRVQAHIAVQDIFIGAAAVADYRPRQQASQKIKKGPAGLQLELEPTPDIVAEVAARRDRPYTVGFAAETEHLVGHARDKLARKRLDLVAANDVSGTQGGFDSDDNALIVVWDGGSVEWPLASKTQLARRLIQMIAQRYHAQLTTENP